MRNLEKALFTVTAVSALLALGGCLDKKSSNENFGVSGGPGGSLPPSTNNRAPTISGNPPAIVTVGDTYSFTPSASDPDGDTLTFSIQNRPVWASFDSGTGRLIGTPTFGDIGSFASIRISVSDGQATASIPDFAVDVTQVAAESVTLSWTAPTDNEDGTTLNDLAGYNIYWGRSSGNYPNTIRVDNPGITSYVVENLSPDTYFFSAAAFNSAGVESRLSGEAVATVD